MSKIKLNNEIKKKPINYNSISISNEKTPIIQSKSDVVSDNNDDNDDNNETDILKILDRKYVDLKKINKTTKLKRPKTFKDDIHDKQKNEVQDEIIKMKNQKNIISTEIVPAKQQEDEYVLEKIFVNDNVYYKDKYRNIIDENTNLVGMWEVETTGNYTYHIFNQEIGKNKVDFDLILE